MFAWWERKGYEMKVRRVMSRAVRLIVVLGLLPIAILMAQGCKPACGAVTGGHVTEDVDWKEVFKQKDSDKRQGGPIRPGKPEPNGGVNPKGGNGAGKAQPCKGGTGGGNKQSGKDSKMLGAKGTKTDGSDTLTTGRVSQHKWRMDVENLSPGKRPGNIHVQLGGTGSTHYYWRSGGSFYTKNGDPLPRKVQKDIDNSPAAQRAIRQGLSVLGEG